jgi:hypothetical protein
MSSDQIPTTETGAARSYDLADAQHEAGVRDPMPPEPSPEGEEIAERYVAAELQSARVALQRTRIASVVLLLLFGGELIYITSRFATSLRPHAAAEIAEGMIMQQINDKGPDVANQLKVKIPEYIEQTPDYVLQQLPNYRVSAEDRLENELNHYCQSTQQQLGQQVDNYLTGHKDQIQELLTSGNDPNVLQQVGKELKQQLMSYVQQKPVGGESMQEQLDTALVALQGTQKTLHRLATARDLTPQEMQTRRALAVLTNTLTKS